MPSRFVWGGFAMVLLCLAFVLSGCMAKNSEALHSKSTDTAGVGHPTEPDASSISNMSTSFPDLTQLPHYPNAEEYRLSASSAFSSSVSFYTTDDYLPVQDFYRKILNERGWREVGTTSDTSVMSLSWEDKSKSPESSYTIEVIINEANDLLQHVQIYMRAWPTEYAVPLLPGAAKVETNVFSGTDTIERTTTYIVAADVPDAEDFYKQSMQKNGWQLDPASKSIETESGLLFVSLRPLSLAFSLRGGYTRVTAERLPDGRLYVTTHTVLRP